MNAKNEFLDATSNCKIIAAYVKFSDDELDFKLKPLYKKVDYDNFLKNLDRYYNNGYGGQELFGIIYCEDGVWFERGEYDGSEWWNINKYPNMSNSFDNVDILRYERYKKLIQLNSIQNLRHRE